MAAGLHGPDLDRVAPFRLVRPKGDHQCQGTEREWWHLIGRIRIGLVVGDLFNKTNDAQLAALTHDGLLAEGRDLDVWATVAHRDLVFLSGSHWRILDLQGRNRRNTCPSRRRVTLPLCSALA